MNKCIIFRKAQRAACNGLKRGSLATPAIDYKMVLYRECCFQIVQICGE